MSKYAAYDQKLLALIDEGCNTSSDLHLRCGPPCYLVESRLQALRKAGKIVFIRPKRIWLRAQVSEVPQ